MKLIKRLLTASSVFVFSVALSINAHATEGMLAHKMSEVEQVYSYQLEDYSYLKNQWKQVWDNWYYFGDDGVSKQNVWAEIDGKWYYFDSFSVMLHDTTTPDGHTVGSDGAWITE